MLEKNVRNSLDKILEQYKELQIKSNDPKVIANIKKYTTLLKQIAKIEPIISEYNKYLNAEKNVQDAKQMLKTDKDLEIIAMAKAEIVEGNTYMQESENKLKLLLLPQDPLDDKNVILEIRGAAGGDEANIFAADLFNMYQKWIDHTKSLKSEILETQYSPSGGITLVVFRISGEKPYSKLKFESGSHRVQRIPKTESSGRIHTSTAVVTVFPEADKTEEIEIQPSDIRIDVFRSSGAGGQSVNTTDSAVRITHLESGIVVSSQDERSQIQNKAKAMTILKAKLFQREIDNKLKEQSSQRKQAGTGDRAEKIRTYNYPQNRITDHRINYSSNTLDKVMDGKLDDIINALLANEQKRKISES